MSCTRVLTHAANEQAHQMVDCRGGARDSDLGGLVLALLVFRRRVAALLLAQAQRSLFRNQVVGSISASIEIRS